MKKLLLLPALIIALSFASCKKEELPKPEKSKSEIQKSLKDKMIM